MLFQNKYAICVIVIIFPHNALQELIIEMNFCYKLPENADRKINQSRESYLSIHEAWTPAIKSGWKLKQ